MTIDEILENPDAVPVTVGMAREMIMAAYHKHLEHLPSCTRMRFAEYRDGDPLALAIEIGVIVYHPEKVLNLSFSVLENLIHVIMHEYDNYVSAMLAASAITSGVGMREDIFHIHTLDPSPAPPGTLLH